MRTLPVNNFLSAVRRGASTTIVYFPLDKKLGVRRQCTLDFLMNSPEQAQSWVESINTLLIGEGGKRRHILVLVNPFSGTKEAPERWTSIVQPTFDLAGVTYEMIETEYQGHARQIAQHLDLSKYDVLTTLSGDGLFWELVNGLMMRLDWQEAVKVPLAVLPGGSANAVAFAAGMGDIETAAFAVARGWARPFDAATVQQANHRCVGFILMAWGMVADVDFESERYRWMGEARFTLMAAQRIAGMRLYRGRFSYVPDESFSVSSGSKCLLGPVLCPQCLPPSYPGPPAVSMDVKDSDILSAGPAKDSFVGLERSSLPPGPPTPFLDALEAGDDSAWTHIDSEGFILVTASNATHIASDMMNAPFAHWADGSWDVVVVKDVAKLTLAKLFLSFEKGEHVNSPDVTYLKCRALHIQPERIAQVESFLDVDGERLPDYGPTGLEVHRGLLQLVTFE